MRQLLGVLREGEDRATGLLPTPGLADLATLLAAVRGAGVDVQLEADGAAGRAACDLVAYRIVQEALTNVVKHAAPAAARVAVRCAPASSRRGERRRRRRPAPAVGRPGLGIVGMRERVAAFGGALTAGPRPGGGCRVARTAADRRGRRMTIRVGLADDQPLVRDGLGHDRARGRHRARRRGRRRASRRSSSPAAARPDVLLMDVRMPVHGRHRGHPADHRRHRTRRRVLVLTTFDLDEYVYAALRAGASGFLLKDSLPEDLFAAIRVVAAGEALLAPARHPPADRASSPAAREPRARRPAALAS